jgi:copper chaperone CopZ
MWSTYDFNSVKSAIISAVSDYLINNKRRDRLPVSDIIKVVELVDGVDSVSIFFDADINNQNYFGNGKFGLDEYGDIVLTRSVTDRLGNMLDINDIQPLFRGNFTSVNGVYYEDNINALVGPINITLRGKTEKQ